MSEQSFDQSGREYVDERVAVVDERLAGLSRAQEVADSEREKAAAQLRSEQHRALDQANEEREKAASALRDGLDRAIKEGDERLREHILNQITQIQSALVSAEKLELERLARVDADVRALAREQTILRETSERAQNKFENEVAARFTQVNEFRASLDDLGKSMATRRELESAKATSAERYEEINKQLSALRSRLDSGPAELHSLVREVDRSGGTVVGIATGREEGRSSLDTTTKVIGSVIAAIVLFLGILNYTSLDRTRTPPAITVTTPGPTVTVTTPAASSSTP